MRIMLDDDEDKWEQLQRMKYYLENYYEGLEDPLNCEPACRVSEIEEDPSCDKCIERMINYILDRLQQNEEFII